MARLEFVTTPFSLEEHIALARIVAGSKTGFFDAEALFELMKLRRTPSSITDTEILSLRGEALMEALAILAKSCQDTATVTSIFKDLSKP